MPLITCQNAAFAYDGKPAVSDLNFDVHAGDYLCIVGENGSGKSTLIKGLLRLKNPVNGTLRFKDDLLTHEIGYLPQQTPAQKDFPAGVWEVVLSGRLAARGLLPFYTKKDKNIAMDHMTRLGIENLKNECYRELSGGQQQRVLLARALCATQKLLILDEPVAGLDPVITAELYRLLHSIHEQTGLTIIMISHDIQTAIHYADHILHLQTRQLYFGRTADYLQTDLGKAYLQNTAQGGIHHD